MLVQIALGAATLMAAKQTYSAYQDLGANIQGRQRLLQAGGQAAQSSVDYQMAQEAVNRDSDMLTVWGFLAVGLGAATAYSIWKG